MNFINSAIAAKAIFYYVGIKRSLVQNRLKLIDFK